MSTESENRSPKEDLEVLWTVKQTAEYFSVIPGTVRRWIREGKIISKKVGSRVRIPRSEVVKLAGGVKEKLQGN